MIEVNHICKEFVSAKKYPGLKGAIKGLFSREKTRKVAVDDISFHIGKGEIAVRFPHNAFIEMIAGDLGGVRFTSSDIKEMKNYFNQ